MSRIRTLFSLVVPSMIAGALVLGSAFGQPAPPTPPAPPPTATTPPTPPAPPKPPKPGKGVSVQINNGTIKIDGIKDTVIDQLDAVRETLKNNKQIPKDVRDKVLPRLDKVRDSVNKRLTNLNVTDLDKLGDEMEKMGEEIEQAMEGLDDDLGKLGDKLGKDIATKLGVANALSNKFQGGINVTIGDDDDDDMDIDIPDVGIDADDDDLRDAISDLKDVALKPAQRDAIVKLRNDSDQQVAAAKKELDDASTKLQTALGDPKATDADIGRYVDQISAKEAQIRKARILTWVQARRVLDDAQRKKIEDAAKTKTK